MKQYETVFSFSVCFLVYLDIFNITFANESIVVTEGQNFKVCLIYQQAIVPYDIEIKIGQFLSRDSEYMCFVS